MRRRRVGVVKLADGADAVEWREVIATREGRSFAAHTRFEPLEKVQLIQQVLSPLQRLGTEREVDGGADRSHRHDGQIGMVRQFARQLDRDVAAQRISRHRKPTEPFGRGKRPDDRDRVRREPRVIQPGRQVFGAAAIALIEEYHVPAAAQRLVGQPAHVVLLGGPLQAMETQKCRPRGPFVLPVTVRAHLALGIHTNQARLGCGQARIGAASRPRVNRDDVARRQPARGDKRRLSEHRRWRIPHCDRAAADRARCRPSPQPRQGRISRRAYAPWPWTSDRNRW